MCIFLDFAVDIYVTVNTCVFLSLLVTNSSLQIEHLYILPIVKESTLKSFFLFPYSIPCTLLLKPVVDWHASTEATLLFISLMFWSSVENFSISCSRYSCDFTIFSDASFKWPILLFFVESLYLHENWLLNIDEYNYK